jgi:probable H4MPT-linked C1 transfer pathway protein
MANGDSAGWLALDIGGANLKAANGRGYAAVRPFALWREPGQLANQLQAVIDAAPHFTRLAATITGELCDCFATKAEGVRAILDSLEAAAAGRPIAVYLTDGRLVSANEARETPQLAAASNWHVLAAFAARFAGQRPALLVDVGSTTTDIILILEGRPASAGKTDPERLLAGELVYTGVERTPVSAVVTHLPWRGSRCPVAAELFATTADAYLLLGDLPEEATNFDTPDGRPRTRAAAHTRIARMICADASIMSQYEAIEAAKAVCDAQVQLLRSALSRVAARMPGRPELVLLSGHGEFLAHRLLRSLEFGALSFQIVSLCKELGPQVSRSAPAHALAVLANEQLPTTHPHA